LQGAAMKTGGGSGGSSSSNNNSSSSSSSDVNNNIGGFSIGDKVKLSSIYKNKDKCLDAQEGPLRFGNDDIGAIVEFNRKRNGNKVQTSRGETWWYTKDALVLIPLTREEALLKSIVDMGFPNDAKAKMAAKMFTSIEAAIQHLASDESTAQVVEIICAVCNDPCPYDQIITLNCDHKVCKPCFEGHCAYKISINEIDEERFTCPGLDIATKKPCKFPITPFEVEANCPKETYEKFIRFANEKLFEGSCVRCTKCNEWWIDISLEDRHEEFWKNVECQRPECKHKFCGKCGEKPHKGQKDQNLTCDQFQAWKKENDASDASFGKFMAENKVHKCPVCKNACVRESGCKYLYCKCSCHLCALCGVELDESQHFAHFKGKPFGEECLGLADITKKPRPKP
jgi:hypothetical protein